MDNRVSVVVPVHNGGKAFEKCLIALSKARPAPYEILVVADGCTDGSVALAEWFGARVIRTAAQSGPARARNLGARAAGGEILFFVDADVVVHPDAIARVLEVFEQNAELAALFGSYDDAPAESNFLSQYKNLMHHFVHQTSHEEASTFWAGCGAIRREVFVAMEGFDERYPRPTIEDIELGYRLRQAGLNIRLCKDLQVTHLKHWGAWSLLKTDFFQRALPWTDLILRYRQFANELNLQHTSRASVVLVYLLLLAFVGAWRWPALLTFAGTAALSLLALNAGLYWFFWRKRGLWFAVRVVPWHWLYYGYSGLAFVLGGLRYLFDRRKAQRPGSPRPTRPEEWYAVEARSAQDTGL